MLHWQSNLSFLLIFQFLFSEHFWRSCPDLATGSVTLSWVTHSMSTHDADAAHDGGNDKEAIAVFRKKRSQKLCWGRHLEADMAAVTARGKVSQKKKRVSTCQILNFGIWALRAHLRRPGLAHPTSRHRHKGVSPWAPLQLQTAILQGGLASVFHHVQTALGAEGVLVQS